MADVRTIPIAQLLFDGRNPRLHHEFGDQRAIIEALLKDDYLGPRILSLAEDIAKFGLNPADLLIVTPEDAPVNHFTVAEGNRRLAALRVLHKPALVEEILPAATVTELRSLANSMSAPITEVQAVIVPTRASADHWIEIRHGGELSGAGILRWDARASDRWRTRHKTAPSFVSQVLDFLQRMGVMPDWYAANPGRFPTTTLDRLLIGAETRAAFGLALNEYQFLVLLNEPETVVKAFAPMIEDLAEGTKTVSDLKRKEQRQDYVSERVMLPPRSSKLAAPVLAETVTPTALTGGRVVRAAAPMKRTRGQLPTRKQLTLIAKAAGLNVTQPRINDIYDELRGIEVGLYPNSVGVMFRVFLELSVDAYIKAQKPPLLSKEEVRDPKKGTLANKIVTVANYMKIKDIMSHKELTSVRKLTQGTALFDSRVTLMNGFVHNSSVTPKPSELKTEWNDLLEFFRQIWP